MSTQQERRKRRQDLSERLTGVRTWPEPLPECECVQCANARANAKPQEPAAK